MDIQKQFVPILLHRKRQGETHKVKTQHKPASQTIKPHRRAAQNTKTKYKYRLKIRPNKRLDQLNRISPRQGKTKETKRYLTYPVRSGLALRQCGSGILARIQAHRQAHSCWMIGLTLLNSDQTDKHTAYTCDNCARGLF